MEWISEYITTREREELAAAIYKYRDVFSSGPEDMGQIDLVTHTIDTGEHRPIGLHPRRLPITKQDVETAEVQKMLDRGIIEPCQSTSPVVLVTKKDGFTRFCVDYRKVNEVTRKGAYPLPWIDDTLDALRGSQYFSNLDLYLGYCKDGLEGDRQNCVCNTTRPVLFHGHAFPVCSTQRQLLKDSWSLCCLGSIGRFALSTWMMLSSMVETSMMHWTDLKPCGSASERQT